MGELMLEISEMITFMGVKSYFSNLNLCHWQFLSLSITKVTPNFNFEETIYELSFDSFR